MALTVAPQEHKTGQFIVLMTAVVLRVGKEKDAVTRYRRGQIITLSTEFTDIRKMLDLKAIAKAVPGKTYVSTTADIARKAAGAADDPVKAPTQDVAPMTPDDQGEPIPGSSVVTA